MLTNAVTVPPVLVPLTTNIVRSTISVAIPLITPLETLNSRPSGRLGSIVQLVISPAPETVGTNGKSALAVSLTIAKSSGV